MMKKFLNYAIIYGVLAMAFGVFYRELTKIVGFTGKTSLSLIHGHYLTLGMFFFLILLLLESNFSFVSSQNAQKVIITYHIGLNIAIVGFLIRGLVQVYDISLSSAFNSALSGIAGVGHILLGVSLIMILLKVKKSLL